MNLSSSFDKKVRRKMVSVIQKGNVAVITGAAAGIGAAAAKYLSRSGMKLVLLDKNNSSLEEIAGDLKTDYRLIEGDVADRKTLQACHNTAYDAFGQVNLLFNNAGIGRKGGPWTNLENWRRVMEVNLMAIVETQAIFIPSLLKQSSPAAVVNLGSKEGITTPPGNAAYSVSKAGVKVLTEQLAHELRQLPNHQVTAHLLVPGYTWTPMNFPKANFSKPETKPEAPWYPEQLMDFFAKGLENNDFYIIALDNEVTKIMDDRRMRWASDDLIYNRPALSRWDSRYQDAFADWLAKGELPKEE